MSTSRFTKLSVAIIFAAAVAGCTVVDQVKTDLSLSSAHRAFDSKNYSAAVDYYRQAAESGSGEGAYWLSDLYLDGKGVKKDIPTGVKWMQTASERNYLPADLSIGLWTIGGSNGIRKDATKGAQLILKAAQAGEPTSMVTMGYLYMKGTGVKRNAAQALEWFQKANAAGAVVTPDLLTLRGVERKMGVKR